MPLNVTKGQDCLRAGTLVYSQPKNPVTLIPSLLYSSFIYTPSLLNLLVRIHCPWGVWLRQHWTLHERKSYSKALLDVTNICSDLNYITVLPRKVSWIKTEALLPFNSFSLSSPYVCVGGVLFVLCVGMGTQPSALRSQKKDSAP